MRMITTAIRRANCSPTTINHKTFRTSAQTPSWTRASLVWTQRTSNTEWCQCNHKWAAIILRCTPNTTTITTCTTRLMTTTTIRLHAILLIRCSTVAAHITIINVLMLNSRRLLLSIHSLSRITYRHRSWQTTASISTRYLLFKWTNSICQVSKIWRKGRTLKLVRPNKNRILPILITLHSKSWRRWTYKPLQLISRW